MLLAALALLPLAGLLFYNAVVQRREAEQHAADDALRLALVCSNNEERMVESADRLLMLMANMPASQSLDARACGPLFTRALGNEAGYANLGLLDANGVLVVSARPLDMREPVGQRSFFKDALEKGKFSVSEFQLDAGRAPAEMICGNAVRTADGRVVGVVFAELDLSWMADLGSRIGLSSDAEVSVLSPNGTTLMRVPGADQWLGKQAPEAAAEEKILEARGSGSMYAQGPDNAEWLFAFTRLDPVDGLADYVSAGIPNSVALDAARRSERRQFTMLGVFALVALAAAWLAADILVLHGVRRLLRATQKVAAGDLRTRAGEVRGGAEFRELAAAFDTMASSIEQQNRQRDVAEEELEKRVEQRTSELAETNRKLQQEIASRCQVEAELRVSKERLDLALKGTNDGIWDWDLATGHVYFSPRWKEMLGYAENEIEDSMKEWEVRLHPEDRDRAFATLHEYFSGKRNTFELEHRLRHKDGTYRWILSRGVVVRNEAGRPIRMAGSHVDLTERRRAEQALRESESKLRAFVTNVPAVLFSIDRAGVITMAEGRGMDALKAGIVGHSVADLYGDMPAVVESVKRALAGESFSTIMQWDQRHFEVSYSPVRAQDGTVAGVIGVAHDISERVHAKEALERTADELRRSNAELEEFAYIASHDLQEPLRMVASYTQLLERRYAEQLDDNAREFIGYAVDGARRMQEFITGLLRYSRVGTEAQVLEEVNLDEACLTALANLRIAIEESGATVTRLGLPVVQGDPRQLTQLFQNLIGNAIKFRKPGQAPVVEVSAERTGEFWRISVRDNGIGLDPRFYERVFIIFQRLHTREEYEGMGLGLAICKKIVERHGGRIWVESKEGEGATFSFTLPAAGRPQP